MADNWRKQRVLSAVAQVSRPGFFAVDYMPSHRTDKALRNRFGLPDGPEGEKALLDILGSDLYYLSARDISQREGYHRIWKRTPEMTEDERTCAFGIRWKRAVGNAKFSVDESIGAPLSGCTDVKQILSYPWPRAKDFDFDLLIGEAEENTDRAVAGGLWTGILGDAYRMLGFQDFLLHIALTPELIKTLVRSLTDVYLELNNACFHALKGKLDIWFFGNDFGTQNGLLFSRWMWREFFFEPIRELCGLAASYGLKVMMHSCGGIKPIIGDLVEAGVDILDPVQITADGMDPEDLLRSFGDRIAFHGGIDTQSILPFGTVEEVREHTTKVVNLLSGKGRYIAAGSQILGDDIPIESILAMYDEIKRLLPV